MKFIATRTIDELGRVVIPSDIRRALGLNANEMADVYLEDNAVVIKRNTVTSRCMLCGETVDLIVYKKDFICQQCKKEISEL